MATVAENLRIHWHSNPNRPPMTPSEVITLSQTIGGLKRSKRTIANARVILSRYEDRDEKKSDSGVMLNAGLKTLSDGVYCLERAIDVLESARDYAKEGK